MASVTDDSVYIFTLSFIGSGNIGLDNAGTYLTFTASNVDSYPVYEKSTEPDE